MNFLHKGLDFVLVLHGTTITNTTGMVGDLVLKFACCHDNDTSNNLMIFSKDGKVHMAVNESFTHTWQPKFRQAHKIDALFAFFVRVRERPTGSTLTLVESRREA
ncbi:unnamed protein product [Polarella glacialis]|uniref:Uncharacterized protein n=1 Tax=Polarella glacialis TaxID=89957 RepID=A0A813GTJ4_POLGL|nr:unnamed protein product [Polarella glacialis]